ncbi:unnamed protein product [Penicillium salamii]|nr:unnamed protein product [Penicillium salamii]
MSITLIKLKYYDFLGKKEYLKSLYVVRKENVIIFLEWLLYNSKIKKFSSLHENWWLWYLIELFNLDRSVGEKLVMNIDDLYIILYHYWTKDTTPYPDNRQIIQLAFLLLTSVYTASRLGADEDLKTLCYNHISLLLLPNPGSICDHLMIEVDLRHTKDHNRKKKSKIYLMSEVKQPFFDIVVLVVAIAFLDNAFESNICLMEDIYASQVEPPQHSLQLRFMKEKHNVPICRQPISTHYSISTHKIKPLKYHMYLYYLKRLSLTVGIPHAIKPYHL